jgi:predicted exporter
LLLLAALAVALGCGVLVSRVVQVRSDIADFLPAGETAAARFMLRELRAGEAASVILVGIEGAAPADLARISAAMATALTASGRFELVSNGQQGLAPADEAFLFAHRYLLAPDAGARDFSVPALRADFQAVLRQMQSSLAPMAAQLGVADPTGAVAGMLHEWAGSSRIRSVDGVWFAPERERALLLLKTRAGGMDVAAQEQVGAAIDAAFRAAAPGGARYVAAGPAVFAREAAANIRADVELLSSVSALMVGGLLLWRFRSPLVVLAIAVPVVLSLAAAALAVQLVFGFVHGIALGFGMTMLGVTVDYPVLLIGHRKPGEPAAGTLLRIGQAFRLAVLTAVLGLSGMALSGFPGLAQLGVFSIAGLLSAALATWLVLPRLIVAVDLAPVAAGEPGRLLRIEGLRRWRLLGLVPVVGAAVVLVAVGGPRWEDDLDRLSPVPPASLALDRELRGELGAPEVGQVALVRGADAEAVLRREEALRPVLAGLVTEGVIGGAEDAADLLPSAATQLARRQALPDDLADRVAAAMAGLGFRDGAFAPFVAAVAASRTLAPVTLSALSAPMLRARLAPLLLSRDGAWFGLVAFRGVRDPARLAAEFAGAPDVMLVDMKRETNELVGGITRRAWRWLAASAVAALAALLIGLRDPARVARIAGAIAAALLVTVAVLTAAGARLSLVHIVAVQFVAGVGLDYALFFARRQLDADERARTLRTLATCNAMTLLTFGLLAFCQTPLLRQIGVTVATGALLAIVFGFLFVGPKPAEAGR